MVALHYHQAILVHQTLQARTREPPQSDAHGKAHPAMSKLFLGKRSCLFGIGSLFISLRFIFLGVVARLGGRREFFFDGPAVFG